MARTVILIPTAHLSKKSVQLVRRTIDEVKPQAVAVELCRNRYYALASGRRATAKELIRRGNLFLAIVSMLQNRLSKQIGLLPGAEMIEAVKVARERNLPVFLIDQDIFTIMRSFRKIPLREKLRMFFLTGGIPKKATIDELTEEKTVSGILEAMRRKMPVTYKALVEDRNRFMARQLKSLPFESVVAVVGAGHASGIKRILEVKNADRRRKKAV
ncbi:MAG: TraB/GumN family protein [archaeon]